MRPRHLFRRLALLALVACPGASALAADLSVAKSAALVSDVLGQAKPRMLPGSIVDYSLTVAYPLLGGLLPTKTIRNVEIVDQIDPAMKLSIADYGTAGSGPVEFTDGGLLGLTGSGLSYRYAPGSIDYSTDGRTWGYRPVAVGGYDPAVRAIKVTLTGTYAAGGSFRLRYRTAVR